VWRYEHCGLRVASECVIAGLTPSASTGEADVRVVVAGHAQSVAAGPRATWLPGGRCRIRFPGVGQFEVCGGEEVAVRPERGASEAQVSLFLLGAVWAALLHQRGAFALHAGVVADGEGTIAFCGPRGAGKSSAVAQLLRRGHTLVSDDLTRLDVREGAPPLVWPSTRRVKLTVEAVAAVGAPAPSPAPPMPDGKLHLPWTAEMPPEPLPLRALYALSWGEPPRAARLRGHEAVAAVAAGATYRPELVEPAEGPARHWIHCTRIAQQVAIHEFVRPRDWSAVLPPTA
jgi:hypothetical protein